MRRTLPADAYDALELCALASGGIGGPSTYEWNGVVRVAPVCLYGHAAWATDRELAFAESNPIADALNAAGFLDMASDRAVQRIRRGRNRIPFREWCKELGVTRGE